MSDNLDPLTAPAYSVKEGGGWLAVFNPDAPRQMDVQLHRQYVHGGVVCCIKFSSDGRWLAVGTNNAVILYDITQDEKVTFSLTSDEGTGKPNHARSVTISPDSKFLVAGSEDNVIRIWDVESYAFIQSLVGHRGEVYALSFTADSRYLLSASGDRTVRLWDTTQLKPGATAEVTCRILRSADSTKSKQVFTSVSVDSLSSFVAAGSLDGIIRVWDIRPDVGRAEPVGVLSGHADGVYGVQFLPSYSDNDVVTLVSASLDRTLRRWEIVVDEKQFLCKQTLTGHKVPSLVFPCYGFLRINMTSQDCVLALSTLQVGREQRLASASRDGTVRLWDLKTGMPYFMIQGHTNTGKLPIFVYVLLASGSGDREVRIWNYTLQ
ncbi:WD40-repeat-containing domain protein [Pisolithus thermaeus]|nr:WD40-repeat-containing domain protein [Pisolithus thermaeus]